jgi:MinD superfamily P-loop ATPase
MAERGFRTIEEFRGSTIKNYFKPLELDDFIPSYAAVDKSRCIKCGICYNNWCPGIYEEGQTATINPEECSGCAMCAMICPQGAIHMFEWGKPAIFEAGKPFSPFGM